MSNSGQDRFPFSLSNNEQEAQAVTWLRDYSSYLTVGGFWNYLALVGVYLRGTLLNLIVLSPILIFASIVLGLLHHPILNHTYWALLVGIMVYLVAGAWVILIHNLDHVNAGDDLAGFRGAIRRLRRERPLGFSIFLLLLVCVIETSPRVIEHARENRDSFDFGWTSLASFVVAASSCVVGGNRLLGYLGRFKTTATIVVLGLASLLLPWVVVLRLADYVVYGVPPSLWRLGIPFYCCFFIVAGLAVSMFAALLSATASWKTIFGIVVALTATCGLAAACLYFAEWGRTLSDDAGKEYIGTLTRPLARLVAASPDPKLLSPGAAKAFTAFQSEKRILDRLADQKLLANGETVEPKEVRERTRRFAFYDSEMDREYFCEASQFLESGERLRRLGSFDQQTLGFAISKRAIESLTESFDSPAFTSETIGKPQAEEPKESPTNQHSFNSIVLKEMIADLTAPMSLEEAEQSNTTPIGSQTLSDQKKVLKKDFSNAAFSKRIMARRMPIRMAESFLNLTGRQDELPLYRRKPDAPDAAMTGPKVVWPSIRSDPFGKQIDDEITKQFWTQRLYRMSVVDLWRDDAARQLKDQAGIGPSLVGDILQSSRERMIASCFELSDLCRLVDKDSTVFSFASASQDTPIRFGSIPEDKQGKLRELLVQLRKPWSAKSQDEVETAISEVNTTFSLSAENELQHLALDRLISTAIGKDALQASTARKILGELYDPSVLMASELPDNFNPMGIYHAAAGAQFDELSIKRIVAARFVVPRKAEPVISRMVFGVYGNLNGLESLSEKLFVRTAWSRIFVLGLTAICLSVFSWLFIDINETAAHGFYRDRLARAFLLRREKKGLMPALDIRLSDLGNRDCDSTAPFHLINGAVNLHASQKLDLRDRLSDHFSFSKHYIGSPSSGYIATPVFESVRPSFSLASAMAISAGAASPNMGQNTNSFLVFLMTLMNLRLGFWVPNPSHLKTFPMPPESAHKGSTFAEDFSQVFPLEMEDVEERRGLLQEDERNSLLLNTSSPDAENQLLGLAFSGGGIRSAAFNLGIIQVLDAKRIFPLVDYMSTVSGGGYLGSSISCAMRRAREPDNGPSEVEHNSDPVMNSYRWRVPPRYFLKEITSQLTHHDRWLNVSDGGHLENLGIYELMRRRCQIIIAGDAEADPKMSFSSLSRLARFARIDMGIEIDWLAGGVLRPSGQGYRPHHGVAKITYPQNEKNDVTQQSGYLVYLKASINGDEDQTISGYQTLNQDFPHQSTADQFFDEMRGSLRPIEGLVNTLLAVRSVFQTRRVIRVLSAMANCLLPWQELSQIPEPFGLIARNDASVLSNDPHIGLWTTNAGASDFVQKTKLGNANVPLGQIASRKISSLWYDFSS